MERDKLILSKLLFQIMIQKNFFFKARPGVSENDMRKGYKGFRECEKLSLFNVWARSRQERSSQTSGHQYKFNKFLILEVFGSP